MKMPRIIFNKSHVLKIVAIVIALILFIGAALIFTNSQNVKEEQAKQSQEQVANHTQTLQQIQDIVTQIKQNNQQNHDTTIKYIQCVVQSFFGTTPSEVQADFNSCVSEAGLAP